MGQRQAWGVRQTWGAEAGMESHRGRDRDGEGDGGTGVVEATEGRGDFV